MKSCRITLWIPASVLFALPLLVGCSNPDGYLSSDLPLHLEEHIGGADIKGSAVPVDVLKPVVWRFDEPQLDWKLIVPPGKAQPMRMRPSEGALRLELSEANNIRMWRSDDQPQGGIYVEVPDWKQEDWSYVAVRARASKNMEEIGLGFNLSDHLDKISFPWPWRAPGERIDVVNDGSEQTYLLRADWSGGVKQERWSQLGLWFDAKAEATLDLISVSVIPKETNYSSDPIGVREEVRNRSYRRSIFTHAPASVSFKVQVPGGGRLDVGLGVLREDMPVTFSVTAGSETVGSQTLFEEVYGDKNGWGQRSVDLAPLAGQVITLSLETTSARPGTVALWAAPTVSGRTESTHMPNVMLYVIDGGAADFMSVYGYNRRTTPNLEKLAEQGAVFDRAHSNSRWTYPSTASFMTSLQNSVLGGQRKWREPVPEQAVTMAQRFHAAGYQTGVFIANPNAGTMSGLQRGVDVFQEDWPQFSYWGGGGNYKESSKFLHEGFWKWRSDYPGSPWWVHFQTTDVHEDFPAVPPFAGLYLGPSERETWRNWDAQLDEEGGHGLYSEAWEKTGLSRTDFFSFHQSLYDETMAHNDYQIGKLVRRLKAEGEWEDTLLILASDHSTEAAMDDMGLAIQETLPPQWVNPLLRPSVTRVPLIFVWPGKIPAGQRFSQPVSNIDILPTILDLVGLPQPEVQQGQSLAPLLLGTGEVESRPIILDELWLSDTGEVQGLIEVIDGRWGASLWIGPEPKEEQQRRPTPLLLFDLWNDYWCVEPVNNRYPDLAKQYQTLLERQWEAHQNLALKFSRSGEIELTPEQLRTLRGLGYIQ